MRRFSLLTLLNLTLGACAHQAAAPTPTAAPSAANPASPTASAAPAATPAATASGARSCRNDTDCGDRQLCIRSQCVDISNGLAECGTVRVHFDFNNSELRDQERETLKRTARCLKADHSLHVTIEGNADERGTQEYNLSLGDQRANAVARYLELLGASKQQLGTVSYGKENPVCAEHNEACWSQNRRAALKPQGAR